MRPRVFPVCLALTIQYLKTVMSGQWRVTRMWHCAPHHGTQRISLATRHLSLATVLIAALATIHSPLATSQTTNASVTGFIMDPQKAVIPGVTVTAINVDTNAKFATHTDKSGSYVLPSLPAGPYRMQIEKPGFKTILKEDLDLHVQAALEVNFQMAVGSTSESITVTGSEAGLPQTTGAVSTVIDRTEIANMPLNGNSLATLFELVPGVVTNAGGSQQSSGGGISVDGQRPTSNSLTVDGASGNIYAASQSGSPNIMGTTYPSSASGGTNGLLPVDAIEEFRMQTSSYDAQYGRTPGGQIEVKTRGGTNEFHGSLFENFRNQVMDATDWFVGYDNAHGEDLKQSPLRYNDFGGTFGGPIFRNRIFVFAAHETLLMDQPQSPTTYDVPDQQTRSSAAAVYQPYMNSYPAGNGGPDPARVGSDLYVFSYSNTIADHSTSIRLDGVLRHDLRGFVRINDAPSSGLNPQPASLTKLQSNIFTATAGLSWSPSSKTVNDFTFNYSADRNILTAAPTGSQSWLTSASSLADLSTTTVNFNTHWVDLYVDKAPQISKVRQFNFIDTFSRTFGAHTLKAGVDWRGVTPKFLIPTQLALNTGFFSPNDFASGTMDLVYYTTNVAQPDLRESNLSLFVNDNWRLTRRLMVTLGLRWEYDPAPTASAPGLVAMQGNPTDPSTITLTPTGAALYQKIYDNFAPRFGLTYVLRDSPRFGTAIRTGGGVFFDTGQAGTGAQAAQDLYPYLETSLVFSIPYSSVSVNQLRAAATGGLPQSELYLTDPSLRQPRTYSWSLTMDQGLGQRTSVSASYVGNSGQDLLKQNVYQGLSPALASTLFVYTNGERSNYNALQAQLRYLGGERLSVLGSYTYAHAIDNGSNDFETVGGLQNNYRANSDNDIRHIFSSAIHYALPRVEGNRVLRGVANGWGIDSIALLQSAAPLSVYSYANDSSPNLYNPYADVVSGVPTVVSNASAPGDKQLNRAAFAVAPGTRDGTSARNGYRLFGLTQWDLGTTKSWPITDRARVAFRVDAFNLLNHPSFTGVDNSVGDPTFGDARTTYAGGYGGTNVFSGALNEVFSNGGPRSIQLSLRIKF